MDVLLAETPWLVAMAGLIVASAFCSASEATLFYLDAAQRRRMAAGGPAQRRVAALLSRPDRLLTAVLFWNLLVNVTYFAIASILGLRLEREGRGAEAGVWALVALLLLIALSEMLPKILGVLMRERLAPLMALPLSLLVRTIGPFLPFLRLVNLLSRRLLWPEFEPEAYLRVRDLEQAVAVSMDNPAAIEQEQRVLRNIVSLSEIRVDELMRPRVQFEAFRPPVSLADLRGRTLAGGYLLVTEAESDEVAAALRLSSLAQVPAERLDQHAHPVAYVPWNTTAAQALETMQRQDCRVAIAVNEHGETIGIITFDDLLDTILSRPAEPDDRHARQHPIRPHGPGAWLVTGTTSGRRLARHFQLDRPPSLNVTLEGILQEILERFPLEGDEADWGGFHLKVVRAPERGPLLVEVRLREEAP